MNPTAGVPLDLPQPVKLRSRLTSGIAWSVLSTVFTQGSTFLGNIIIANTLGKDVFGEYGITQSTVFTVVGFAQLAAGSTVAKYVAEFRLSDRPKAARILSLCTAISIVSGFICVIAIFLSSHWLAANYLGSEQLGTKLALASLAILFAVMNGTHLGALTGLEEFKGMSYAAGASAIINLTIIFLFTRLWGFSGAILSLVGSTIVRWVFMTLVLRSALVRHNIALARSNFVQSIRDFRSELAVLLHFVLPAALAGFTGILAIWLANSFLVRGKDGFGQMALYNAANNFRLLILFVPTIATTVALSILNNEKGLHNEVSYKKVFWTNVLVSVGMVLAAAGVLICFGPWLLRLFGKDFGSGQGVLVILALSTIPETIAMTTYKVINSHGKMWLSLFGIALPRDILMVVLSYIWLAEGGGATKLATIYLICIGVSMLLTIIWTFKIGLSTAPQK